VQFEHEFNLKKNNLNFTIIKLISYNTIKGSKLNR